MVRGQSAAAAAAAAAARPQEELHRVREEPDRVWADLAAAKDAIFGGAGIDAHGKREQTQNDRHVSKWPAPHMKKKPLLLCKKVQRKAYRDYVHFTSLKLGNKLKVSYWFGWKRGNGVFFSVFPILYFPAEKLEWKKVGNIPERSSKGLRYRQTILTGETK